MTVLSKMASDSASLLSPWEKAISILQHESKEGPQCTAFRGGTGRHTSHVPNPTVTSRAAKLRPRQFEMRTREEVAIAKVQAMIKMGSQKNAEAGEAGRKSYETGHRNTTPKETMVPDETDTDEDSTMWHAPGTLHGKRYP